MHIADVGVVARGVHVLIDSSLSPRMYGRGMRGMSVAEIARVIGEEIDEFARDVVVSELAGAKSWSS